MIVDHIIWRLVNEIIFFSFCAAILIPLHLPTRTGFSGPSNMLFSLQSGIRRSMQLQINQNCLQGYQHSSSMMDLSALLYLGIMVRFSYSSYYFSMPSFSHSTQLILHYLGFDYLSVDRVRVVQSIINRYDYKPIENNKIQFPDIYA